MSYEVRLEQFNGPLDKLLELIEQKQIAITQLSLADVTADFIAYVQRLEKERGIEPSILADFIVVAAKMLLIKSKVLLPSLELTQEEEEEILDLETRLKIYREFKSAGVNIAMLWDKNQSAHSREFLASLGDPSAGSGQGQKFFYPPAKTDATKLVRALETLFELLKDLIPETKKVQNKTVTLQQKIAELSQRLETAIQFTVKGLASKKDRQEVIVLFLAVLHMLANKLADVEQTEHFSDMIVKKVTSL